MNDETRVNDQVLNTNENSKRKPKKSVVSDKCSKCSSILLENHATPDVSHHVFHNESMMESFFSI